MNKTTVKRLEKELVGKTISGWTIQEYINSGKSAAVFKAQNADKLAAIKLFDPEIVEKHGAEIQIQRIEREKSLIGKSHPNLIEILDGGHWADRDLYFIVMEFMPWKNLAEVLPKIPIGLERLIISQVASAARFLEGLAICHRDIKTGKHCHQCRFSAGEVAGPWRHSPPRNETYYRWKRWKDFCGNFEIQST